MARAATTQELAYFRSERQVTQLRVAVYNPAPVLVATVATPPSSNDGVKSVSFTAVSGSYAAVQDGMTALIGTSSGADDLGVIRVISATSSVLSIGATSEIAWQTGQYITVLPEWLIWPRQLAFNGGVWNIEGDVAYTNQNATMAPVPVLGPLCAVKRLTGATVTHSMSASASWVPGSTISGYSWTATGASATSGLTTATPTLTYNAVGSYRVDCTVTAANGTTSTGHRYILVINDAGDGALTQISVKKCGGDMSGGGWSYDVTGYMGVNTSAVRDRALMVLYARDWYGGTEIEIGPIEGYENVVCCGWIEGETIHQNPELGTVSFTVSGPAAWMAKIASWPISIMDTTGTPADWMHINTLTIDKALWHLVHWRSTIDKIVDVYPSGDTRRAFDCSANAGPLWEQLKLFCDTKIGATPGVDRYGRLVVQVDAQLVDSTERSAIPVVQALSKVDWSGSIDLQVKLPTTALLETGGFAFVGGAWIPMLSRAPGNSMIRFGSGLTSRYNLEFNDQTSANALTAALFAKQNNIYENVPVDLAENNRLIDIVPRQYLTMTVAAGDTPRGIVWTNQRVIPRRVEHSYENGLLTTSIEVEVETIPGNAVTMLPPSSTGNTSTVTPSNPTFPAFPSLPGVPGYPPVITDACAGDIGARGNGPFTLNFSPSALYIGQSGTATFPCAVRMAGAFYPTRLQLEIQKSNDAVVSYTVDAMNGGGVAVSGVDMGDNYWQFAPVAAVNVTGFRVSFSGSGSGVISSATVPIDNLGIEISGLTIGKVYTVESTGFWFLNGANNQSRYFDLNNGSGWQGPADAGYDGSGGYTLTDPIPQYSWADGVGCVANCTATHNQDKNWRVTFHATTTSIFMRVSDNIFSDNNNYSFGYVLRGSSSLLIQPSSLYNVCDPI